MDFIVATLQRSPELAIFLSLAIGYWIGVIKLGSFSLGTVTGTLLAAGNTSFTIEFFASDTSDPSGRPDRRFRQDKRFYCSDQCSKDAKREVVKLSQRARRATPKALRSSAGETAHD